MNNKTKKIVSISLSACFFYNIFCIKTLAINSPLLEAPHLKTNDTSIQMMVNPQNEQGIMSINNNNSPKEYTFTLNLNPFEHLVTSKNYLGAEFDTGEVYIVNNKNAITGIIDKPWAYDAKGVKVPTYFTVSGNKITQHVEYTEKNAFPITADPNAWQVTKCVAAIAFVLGTTVFGAAKVLKIKKYIKACGGLKLFAQLIMAGAASQQEIFKVGGMAFLEVAKEVSGISSIEAACIM